MPKFKPSMSVSVDDHDHDHGHAFSPNGAITEGDPNPSSSPTLLTRKKAYSPDPGEEQPVKVGAGRLPEEVYTNMLPWWRAALRRKFVAVVECESEVIGKWQVRFFFFSLPFSSQHSLSTSPGLLYWRGHGVGRDRRKCSYRRSFAGASAVALVGHVFFADVDARHSHVLPRVPAHDFFPWVRQPRKRVRALISVFYHFLG